MTSSSSSPQQLTLGRGLALLGSMVVAVGAVAYAWSGAPWARPLECRGLIPPLLFSGQRSEFQRWVAEGCLLTGHAPYDALVVLVGLSVVFAVLTSLFLYLCWPPRPTSAVQARKKGGPWFPLAPRTSAVTSTKESGRRRPPRERSWCCILAYPRHLSTSKSVTWSAI